MKDAYLNLGVDVANRASHVASLADRAGQLVWTNHRFRTTVADLEKLWSMIPRGAVVTVVLEPTGNAWVPAAAWLSARGARIVLVPPEQSADLRKYYDKHTKNDRLDSVILARLPLLHPDGLLEVNSFGPTEPLRRAVRRREKFVGERTRAINRLTALVELLGPGFRDAFPSGLHCKSAFAVLRSYANPRVLRRLGLARLTGVLHRASRGSHGEAKARQLLAAANEALAFYPDGRLDFAALAEDIQAEVRAIDALDVEIARLDERIAGMNDRLDPSGILTSVPGVGPVLGPAILGRIGDLDRFANQAAVRSFAGLVPSTSESGKWASPSRITKAGDPGLRHALFIAADLARQTDPTLAAKYRRLMVERGHHHNSALCNLAATLLTRIAACWRAGEHYQIRDLDGQVVTPQRGRAICAERYKLTPLERNKAKHRKADRATTEVA